jgi:hypothetical protein
MNTPKAVAALNTMSMALGELAEALAENGTAPVSAAPVALPPLAAEDFPPFAPVDYEPVGIPASDPVLSVCPNHGTPWTVKAAGVSKAGKPYQAFFKCDGKNADGTYCSKKPTREWADAHAARLAAA